jgi:DNA-binding CsgD family transcriptional regulator
MSAWDVALESVIVESAFAAVLLEVPSRRVVAASPAAVRMLAPHGGDVIGRDVNDFTIGDPSGALPLLMAGRLDGYETTHELDRPGGGGPLTIWVRRIDDREPPTHVMAVLTAPGHETSRLLPGAPGRYVPPVLGSTGPDLLIDRISCEIATLVGTPAEELLGQSLLTLVTPASASALLWGLAQSTTHGTGAPLHLDLLGADGGAVPVQLLIMPLHPPASCAFSILPRVPVGDDVDVPALEAHELLAQLARGVDALGTAREMAGISASNRIALARLSARELDIVTRLLAGDRVPAIAKALFLSPSTVRNQLSSAFTKVGVHSQQELLDVLRNQDAVSPMS